MTLTAAPNIPLITLAAALADAGLVLRPDMRGGVRVVQQDTDERVGQCWRSPNEWSGK